MKQSAQVQWLLPANPQPGADLHAVLEHAALLGLCHGATFARGHHGLNYDNAGRAWMVLARENGRCNFCITLVDFPDEASLLEMAMRAMAHYATLPAPNQRQVQWEFRPSGFVAERSTKLHPRKVQERALSPRRLTEQKIAQAYALLAKQRALLQQRDPDEPPPSDADHVVYDSDDSPF